LLRKESAAPAALAGGAGGAAALARHLPYSTLSRSPEMLPGSSAMPRPESQSRDDPSSAPESGTVRDETSGNNPATPQAPPPPARVDHGRGDQTRGGDEVKDDPSVAGEER